MHPMMTVESIKYVNSMKGIEFADSTQALPELSVFVIFVGGFTGVRVAIVRCEC